MRHKKKGRKFGRKRDQRRAMLKTLAGSLIVHERIRTSEAKAKELRSVVEPLITLAKRRTLASYRLLRSRLPQVAAKKLFDEVAERYAQRRGGYTRVIKAGRRSGDGAKMAVIEFV